MSKRAEALIEKRNVAVAAARTILEAAGDERLNAEQRTAYDLANADIDSYDVDIRSEIEDEKRTKAHDELRAEMPDLTSPASPAAAAVEEDAFSKEMRAFLNGETRALDFARAKPMSTDEFRALAKPYDRRSLNKLTAAAGNNTVATGFYDQLLQHLIVSSGLLSAGPTVLATSSGEPMQFPKTTAHSTAALTAEAATIAESDPTFGQLTLGAFKYAVLVQVSRELVEDTSVDLLGYLSMQMGRAVGNKAGADFINGGGTTAPRGILLDATLGVTGATGVVGAFTADNLIDTYYSVIAPYRNSPDCGWLMADATMGAVRKLKDSENRYLWQPSIQVGAPDTLLGKTVNTDPNVPLVGVGNKSVIFGDISRYFVRTANGLRFENSNDFAFSSDLVTFKAVWRADGALTDLTGAVKYFIGGAS